MSETIWIVEKRHPFHCPEWQASTHNVPDPYSCCSLDTVPVPSVYRGPDAEATARNEADEDNALAASHVSSRLWEYRAMAYQPVATRHGEGGAS